jgi:tRNA pseudouridine55 synthase
MSRRSTPGAPEGILLVDKPAGWTSHDVVAKTRKITGQRRLGHTGTLDPMATGLLVLCLGRATRLVEFMTSHEKRYEGVIALGVSTTTDDAAGEMVGSLPLPVIDEATLRALETRFKGRIEQTPPVFSAVSVRGERAYAIARRGGSVQLEPRPVEIHTLQLTAISPDRLGVRVRCGPGTYVRALARDIGTTLGCGAHLAELRRLSVGTFELTHARSLEAIAAVAAAGRLPEILLPVDDGIVDLPAILLANARGARLLNGELLGPLQRGWHAASPARIYAASGDFLAIGEVDSSGIVSARKVLASPDKVLC